MTRLQLAATASAVAILPGLASAAHVDFVLDDFSTDQYVADAPTTDFPSTSTVGNRTFTVDNRTATAAFATSLQSGGDADVLDFNNNTGVAGWGRVDYALNADLSDYTQFSIDLLSYDQANSMSDFTISANGTEVNRQIGEDDIGTLTFDFSSFGGVDFSNISSLALLFDAENARAVDIAFDNFGVNGGPAPVPLPAAGLLLVGGLGALGAVKRRKG